jgi:hypothetical protein
MERGLSFGKSRMGNTTFKDKILPALSAVLLYALLNLSLIILITLKLDIKSYAIAVIVITFMPVVFKFIELIGYKDKLWSYWKLLPTKMHVGICIITASGLCYMLKNTFSKTIRIDYEKNKY